MNYRDDNEMFYNLDEHRYVLTPEHMADKYGIQLSDILDADGMIDPERLPEMFLDRVSFILYSYIYLWSSEHDKTEYALSLERYREGIKKAMGEFCYTWLMNNTDPSVFFSGNALRAVEVPPSVQTILLQYGITFRGNFFNMPNNWQAMRGIDY